MRADFRFLFKITLIGLFDVSLMISRYSGSFFDLFQALMKETSNAVAAMTSQPLLQHQM